MIEKGAQLLDLEELDEIEQHVEATFAPKPGPPAPPADTSPPTPRLRATEVIVNPKRYEEYIRQRPKIRRLRRLIIPDEPDDET